MIPCPTCGWLCKNAAGVGSHVAQTHRKKHQNNNPGWRRFYLSPASPPLTAAEYQRLLEVKK